jgi:ribosomal protein L37AE/L43A
MITREMTEEQVRERIDGLDAETQKQVVCALVGHSRIQTHCFGYWYCGRCDAQVGDTLGGAYDANKSVLVGHDCEVCRKNAESLTWRDTMLAPDPFPATLGAVE